MEINRFNKENSEIGFALLKGNNWCYYMKKLYCIIGRAPVKFGIQMNSSGNSKNNKNETNLISAVSDNSGNTTWHIDVDLGQNKRISKQHGIIAYNFHTCSFEILNISKNFPIKVNGEIINYGEDMPLTSKSLINIGNQEFYFLLSI